MVLTSAPAPSPSAGPFAGIDIDVLRTFVAIVETGSFSKAATRILRTPSAVSMQIKKLEDVLGVPVFARDSRSVSLTSDGELLLTYARRILALSNEMMARFMTPEAEGTVRFGAPDDYGDKLIPPLLKRFAETHPNVVVDVVIATSDELKARFARDELDLMLITTLPSAPLASTDVVVLEDELVWAGVKAGCAWERDPLPLSIWEEGCAWRANAIAALDKAGRDFRIAYLSAHSMAQRAAVLSDLAVAPFPASFIDPPLVRLGPKHGLPELGSFHIRMVTREGTGCCTQAIADHLIACFDGVKSGEVPCDWVA